MEQKKLIKEVVDYACIIRTWEVKSYFGKTVYATTIHPRNDLKK